MPCVKPRQTLWMSALCACLLSLVPWSSRGGEQLLERVLQIRHTGDLAEIRARRELRVLVSYSKTDFFLDDKAVPRGIQTELANTFLKHLNKDVTKTADKVHLRFILTPFAQLIPDLLEGKGDVAAAMLTRTEERTRLVDIVSGESLRVSELLVSHKSADPIRQLGDLAGKTVHVLAGSSYLGHLQQVNKALILQGLEAIDIQVADPHLNSENILEMVNAGVMERTVVDDYKAKLWSQVLTDIRVHEDLAIARDNVVGWAVRKDSPQLRDSLQQIVGQVKKGSLLGNILFKRYFESSRWIDNPLTEQQRQKLRRLSSLFRMYGDRYDFDYLALIAQAYQESQLNHKKRSPRGALGIMQLLPSTAADPNIGIGDIKTLENNIHAGAKYLAFLRNRYFPADEISDPLEQFAFSWAAYNAGPARIQRLRKAAAEAQLNRNRWFDNVELMAAQDIGAETIDYVRNILQYYVAYGLIRGRIENWLDNAEEQD